MSPIIAEVLARGGLTKDHVRKYLYENIKVPAGLLEEYGRAGGHNTLNLCQLAEEGVIPKDYCESTDPNRLFRAFLRPDWIGIVISGDPTRNQSKGYVNNHRQGAPVSKKIELPTKWRQLMTEVGK